MYTRILLQYKQWNVGNSNTVQCLHVLKEMFIVTYQHIFNQPRHYLHQKVNTKNTANIFAHTNLILNYSRHFFLPFPFPWRRSCVHVDALGDFPSHVYHRQLAPVPPRHWALPLTDVHTHRTHGNSHVGWRSRCRTCSEKKQHVVNAYCYTLSTLTRSRSGCHHSILRRHTPHHEMNEQKDLRVMFAQMIFALINYN